MADDIATAKAALRRAMKPLRAVIDPAAQAEAARALAGHAAALAGLRPAGVVSGYVPIRGEIDPRPLMAALEARGWRCALPRIEGEDISFRIHRPGDALACGGFGLTEPQADAAPARPDLILVPLLAFDRAGHRLGYGRGYYDRALARLPGALAVGVAHRGQEVAAVPVDDRDMPLAMIATDGTLIDCAG